MFVLFKVILLELPGVNGFVPKLTVVPVGLPVAESVMLFVNPPFAVVPIIAEEVLVPQTTGDADIAELLNVNQLPTIKFAVTC